MIMFKMFDVSPHKLTNASENFNICRIRSNVARRLNVGLPQIIKEK